jgi:hypothetical protein
MFERSELRSRREERMENGVKNLKEARLFPKTFSNNRIGNACDNRKKIDFNSLLFYSCFDYGPGKNCSRNKHKNSFQDHSFGSGWFGWTTYSGENRT